MLLLQFTALRNGTKRLLRYNVYFSGWRTKQLIRQTLFICFWRSAFIIFMLIFLHSKTSFNMYKMSLFDILFLYAYILTNVVFLHYMWCALNWKTNYNVAEKYPLFVQKQSNLSIFSTSGILRRIVITNRIIIIADTFITSLERNICFSVKATLF